MKNSLLIILLVITFSSFAQQDEEKFFFHDISFDYGLFASLNGYEHENLVGNKLNFQTTFYFFNDMGIRTGISYINDMEGTDKFYSVPVQFVYRTPVDKSFMIGGSVKSIEDLLFKIILGLIPRQADFHCGFNMGYIKPGNVVSYHNGVPWEQEHYKLEKRFLTTLDLGLRLQYKIKRFGIVMAPCVSYMLTQNFKYYSETGFDQGYTPKWFMSITVGLAYQF